MAQKFLHTDTTVSKSTFRVPTTASCSASCYSSNACPLSCRVVAATRISTSTDDYYRSSLSSCCNRAKTSPRASAGHQRLNCWSCVRLSSVASSITALWLFTQIRNLAQTWAQSHLSARNHASTDVFHGTTFWKTFLLLLLLCSSWSSSRAMGVGPEELCVVRSPLDTQYLTAAVDDLVDCRGCLLATSSVSRVYDQVHVLHVSAPPSGKVLVVLAGGKVKPPPRVALFLHSSLKKGASFTVTASDTTDLPAPFVLVSGEDRLEGEGPELERHKRFLSERELLPMASSQLGPVTSFTTSQKTTRVIIHLDKMNDELFSNKSKSCDYDVEEESPVVTCFITRPVPLAGCYDHSALSHSNIYIVAVDGQRPEVSIEVVGSDTGVEVRHHQQQRSLQDGPFVSSGHTTKENVTLVLTSSKPRSHLKWILSTAGFSGRLSVVLDRSDGVLQQESSKTPALIEVHRRDLPSTFVQLLIFVLNHLGPFKSYVTTAASRIRLTVAPRPEVSELVNMYLGIECPPRHMIASLPRWVTERMAETSGGRVFMVMADHPSCRSKDNGTHIVLDARLDSCGFWKKMHRQKGLFVNTVRVSTGTHFETDDEDMLGSGSGLEQDDEDYADDFPLHSVEVSCPAPVTLPESPSVPLPPLTPPVMSTVSVTPALSFSPKQEFVSYNMSVEAVPEADSVTHVKLRVTANIVKDASPYLRLLLDECWLNRLIEPGGHRIRTLVKKSCDVGQDVVILNRKLDNSTTFTFIETKGQQNVFLHCKLGVCSTDSNHSKEFNIEHCREPSQFCQEMTRPLYFKMASVAHIKTLTSGPLPLKRHRQLPSVVPEMPELPGVAPPMQGTAAPSVGQEPLRIIEGVATEVVIGISISSFLIGVCFTGALWIIHVRTDPRRQPLPDPVAARSSGYDLSANSGSTTPSSQAPMNA